MWKTTIRNFVLPAIAMVLTLGVMYLITGESILPENEAGEVMGEGSTGVPSIGGAFTLTNQHGETVSSQQFQGKYMLVYFGFTHCPDICPTDLTTITAALESLSEAEQQKIQPVFITIDPVRDTVARMKDYAANFYGGLQALTGDVEIVKAVEKNYRVYSQKVDDASSSDGYTMNHSAYMYVMDEKGQYETHFSHGVSPEELADGLKPYLQ